MLYMPLSIQNRDNQEQDQLYEGISDGLKLMSLVSQSL